MFEINQRLFLLTLQKQCQPRSPWWSAATTARARGAPPRGVTSCRCPAGPHAHPSTGRTSRGRNEHDLLVNWNLRIWFLISWKDKIWEMITFLGTLTLVLLAYYFIYYWFIHQELRSNTDAQPLTPVLLQADPATQKD